jgi:hypothetical protein
MNPLTPFLIRLLAAWSFGLLTQIADYFGVNYAPEQIMEVAEWIANWAIPAAVSFIGIVKVLADKKWNKGNASAAPLIARENHEASVLGRKTA